jgi:hypothetical protein
MWLLGCFGAFVTAAMAINTGAVQCRIRVPRETLSETRS